MKTPYHAAMKLLEAWPGIVHDCRETLVLCPSNTRIIILALPATGGLQCRADANFPLWFSHRSNANR